MIIEWLFFLIGIISFINPFQIDSTLSVFIGLISVLIVSVSHQYRNRVK